MNRNNVLGSFLLVVLMSVVLGLYLLYPTYDDDLKHIRPENPSVYSPEKELLLSQYGSTLIDILDVSRGDPNLASQQLEALQAKFPDQDKAIYRAYELMILSNLAQHKLDTEAVSEYVRQIKALAQHEHMGWLKAQSLVELAIEYISKGELAESEIQIRAAIDIAESLHYEELLIKAYNTAGVINNIRNDFPEAQYFFHKGLDLGKKYPHHIYNSKLVSNMALLYIYLEDWPKALELIQKAKKLYYNSGLLEASTIGVLHVNESFAYLRSGELVKGREAYQSAAKLNGDNVSERYKIILLKAESDVLLAEKNFESARQVANLCLRYPGVDKYTLQLGQCYLNRALANIGLNRDNFVFADLKRSHAMFDIVGSRSWKVLGLRTLAEYYDSRGDSENALRYFKLYYKGNKALLFDKRQSDIFLLEQDFATASLAKENELLNAEKELGELTLDKQQLRNRIVVALGIMVMISATLLLIRLRSIQKTNKELLKQSTRCELTGLYNRRYLEQLLTQPMSFNSSQFGISLVILDLDHFKRVNDTFGHDIGDEVLVEVARRVKQHLSPNDVVARWGGEEFVMLLSGSIEPEQQLNVIRLAISETPIDTHSGFLNLTTSIGASIGITQEQLNHDTCKKFLKAADDALYQAKESGRNQVIIVEN
ncbi:GGDEF domain protein [Vibrio crassostreae]|uniref:diguanylate cyclase n=1 Tax=Vibrio crassostreae TaxID=246167 RepID=A0ABP1WPS0_9VIBR|nr:GGDEF domain-containing protein [Vibrio crassostreae]ROO57683.1 diguanylate cyclase (GGDEF)-like protein [Vibrio crassostreae]ROO75795.1 diguanylate cyclase (GGDEF)-like protein [Vibrio crassostreae]ROO77045.1 diguanylate cyclase (GGDEF)-like protein [Vibrio crassostreae]ROP13802.1 diguanylate cyclase (GGDEF)-like protein [Vibrio crassostreae]ROP23032.1 diguanylate cyclase (GGDEF)-like protein [Vibrio crassostreae]